MILVNPHNRMVTIKIPGTTEKICIKPDSVSSPVDKKHLRVIKTFIEQFGLRVTEDPEEGDPQPDTTTTTEGDNTPDTGGSDEKPEGDNTASGDVTQNSSKDTQSAAAKKESQNKTSEENKQAARRRPIKEK